MTSSVAVSTFNNVSDPNVVSTYTGEWSAFATGLRTPLSKDIAKEDLPLWSLAEFRDGYRHADNVHSITALTLDVDESPIPDAHALVHALSGLTSVCYSSSSATHAKPRWRATIQLSRPVTAEEYSKLSVAFTKRFLWFPVGCASKDPARQWYWPREGSDGHYEWISIIGEPLDVDTLLSLTPTVAKVRETSKSTTARCSAVAAPVPISDPENDYGQSRLFGAVQYLERATLSIEGHGGRDAFFSLCCFLMRRLRLPLNIAIDCVDVVYNPRLEAAGTTTWGRSEIEDRLVSARDTSSEVPPGDVFDEDTWTEINVKMRAS